MIAALLAVWSTFVVHLVGAAHREELVIADALMAFVLFGVSALLLGATKDADEQP